MKRLTTLLCLLLSVTCLQLQAKSGFEIQGLNNAHLHWNGKDAQLTSNQSFCVRINNSLTPPVPSQLNNVDIQYDVQLQGKQGNQFQAINGQHAIPLSIRLDTGEGLREMVSGEAYRERQGAALCGSPGSNVQLQIKSLGNLSDFPAGQYRGTIALVVSNNRFGTRDSQEFDVDIRIPRLIRISGDNEINLNTFNGNQASKGQASLCVFRNGSGAFRLTAEGATGDGSFQLANLDRHQVKPLGYQVSVRSNDVSLRNLSPGQVVRGLKGSSSLRCATGDNLTVETVVPKRWAENAWAGHYQGKLKLTVEVE